MTALLFPRRPPPAVPHRVVITGAGVVTSLGLGWKVNAEGFRSGRTGFRPISIFDVSRQRVKVGAEVDLPEELPPTRLDPRQKRRLDRANTMLLLATLEAWQQAQCKSADDLPLVLGTTGGGMSFGEAYFRQAVGQPERHRQQATRAHHYQAQVHARTVLEALGCNGPITIISNACASGASSIGHAWELLRGGQAETVLSGGYDSLNEFVFSGFNALQALSPTVCRPFDARRDGLAIGEGAAVLVMETLESAQKRGAVILGELAGYGTVIDSHHLTQPQPQGEAAMAAMKLACDAARLTPADIDYVNAHGTGTQLNDGAEAVGIRRWAGKRAGTLPVSSTKAGIGHVLGGAGSIEAVVCLMCLRERWLPPERSFEIPDPECIFPIVREPQDADIKVALSNSFGFGGVNATLIFRRWA